MDHKRRATLKALAMTSGLAGAGFAGAALAQQAAWPRQPVKLYVGASPGGAPDAMGRLMARLLGESWGQPLVVDNKPGAAGMLAAEITSKAPADGYSLCLVLDSVVVNQPLLLEKMPLDPVNDLKPIAIVGSFPLILVANPNIKIKTLKDFVAEARANPGKIDYGSSGVGSSVHLAMEVLQRAAGFKVNHVPYKGGIPALQDVIAGHIPLMWSSVTAAVPLMQGGKIIPLGIGSAERFPLLPNVPTLVEQGFAGFSASNWIGVLGPKQLPDAIAQKLQADFAALARNTAYRDAMIAQGIEPRATRSDDFARQITAEYNANKALFASIGLGPK